MKRKPKHVRREDWEAVASPPLRTAQLKRMRPVSETHPGMPARVRGPQKAPRKIAISIRLSPEVVAFFKAKGRGWQSRIDDALKGMMRKSR